MFVMMMVACLKVLFDCADVMHTVGPQGEFADKLKSCYESCIEAMTENSLKSVVRLLFQFISAQHAAGSSLPGE